MQKDLKAIFGDQPPGLDERSINSLTKALEQNNLPGFDYLEYKQSIRALGRMNMDSETAYKSAYATASTIGLTKDHLIKSAVHYREVLKQEKKKFDVALNKQMQQRVESKRKEIELLKEKVAEHIKRINQLQAEVAEAEGIIAKADDHIKDQLVKLENTKTNFETALESILNQINEDIELINRIIE